MRIEIRPLRSDDDRSSFSSGDVELDRFFRKYAGQNQFRLHIGTTYVASTDGIAVGYVTVAPGSIVIERLPHRERQRLPAYPLPILRLARLAVATTHQGHGIGSRLVRFVLELAQEMADRFGCVGVVVDAQPAAIGFYVRLGFSELPLEAGESPSRPQPRTLFLPIGSIPTGPG
jgi:predicted N-acetyltransferase YhbS